ncbi:hypothetical protein AJ80_03454 [Polytolypa hystricis UAMH7299]|uniref:BZIP domain-containing protein n=1 Tax=Polytolypa hystricis (strain UAMH7299) TaxID=1447883 RepID=A0A2B7YJM1_POLH7|nr:hypothetical protein AJ80_03454 [Polytolypa hystricis UAMH7299]
MAYNGRRAPNFSQYLNDLNTIPSPYDQSIQQPDIFDVDAELAMFTNAEFLDFDNMADLPGELPEFKLEDQARTQQPETSSTTNNASQNMKYMELLSDFNLPEYPDYSSPMIPMQNPTYPAQQLPRASLSSNGLNSGVVPRPTVPQAAPTPSAASPTTPTTPGAGTKQRQDSTSMPALDGTARVAQEEDKRRRNTAASARFRIKKKEREKNMERTVKDVTAKNATLEARITQLEMENRWLKNLITEKNGSMVSDSDLPGMFKKFQESAAASPDQQPHQPSQQTRSFLPHQSSESKSQSP